MVDQARSNRIDVRNPMLGDPDVIAVLHTLCIEHPPAADALISILRRLAKRWRSEADEAWHCHKAPIGGYRFDNAFVARHSAVILKSMAVNAGHLARAGAAVQRGGALRPTDRALPPAVVTPHEPLQNAHLEPIQ